MVSPVDWKREARRILRAELAAKDVSLKELARKLEVVGVEEDAKVLSNKINRGTFSFIFFLQCMKALGVETITLRD